ncbi:MAG TPA: hypothetical protein VKU85_04715 [bacterium]|nr:hypothetical protein [bacterium]
MRVVAWQAWPLRRSPGRGALAVVVVAGSVWGVASWTGNPWLTALAVVVLGASVAPFFVPTGYRLSDEGVEVRKPWRRRSRPWDEFRAVLAGKDLVVLSPFERRTWLETIRGETLLLEDNRGEVLDYVEEMVGRKAGSGTGGGGE